MMYKYIIVRLIQAVPLTLGILLIIFLMLQVIPGDPAIVVLGVKATPEELQRVRYSMKLDRPWYIQFSTWSTEVLKGNLGISYINHKPVFELVFKRLPATLELTFWGMLIALIVGIPAGVISAVKRSSLLDYVFTSLSLLGVSIPSFWLGILLIQFFSLKLGWLPASGYIDWNKGIILHLKHLFLPSLSLGLLLAGYLARFSRSSTLEVLTQDHVRTARAKGLPEWYIIIHHILRNALTSIITIVSLQFASLLSGAVVVESIFSYPGIGLILLTAINQRDYPVVLGVTIVSAFTFVLSNLIIDIVYTLLNPKIRYGQQ